MTPETAHRILVVEDDPAFARTLVRRLEAEGHEVACAHDGREGMKAIVTLEPELVISDWMMPHVDGLELCRAVKTGFGERAPYFVLITARDDINARLLALETGADDFLVKPCHDGELSARVRSGLRQVALRGQVLALNDELEQLRTELSGRPAPVTPDAFMALCGDCGKVADAGEWLDLMRFIERRGLVSFRPSTCPHCIEQQRCAAEPGARHLT